MDNKNLPYTEGVVSPIKMPPVAPPSPKSGGSTVQGNKK